MNKHYRAVPFSLSSFEALGELEDKSDVFKGIAALLQHLQETLGLPVMSSIAEQDQLVRRCLERLNQLIEQIGNKAGEHAAEFGVSFVGNAPAVRVMLRHLRLIRACLSSVYTAFSIAVRAKGGQAAEAWVGVWDGMHGYLDAMRPAIDGFAEANEVTAQQLEVQVPNNEPRKDRAQRNILCIPGKERRRRAQLPTKGPQQRCVVCGAG